MFYSETQLNCIKNSLKHWNISDQQRDCVLNLIKQIKIKPKKLVFKEGEPFLNKYPTQIAEIKVLTMDYYKDDQPAHYVVMRDWDGNFKASFFAMNRGIVLKGNNESWDEAKRVCQDHFNRLIFENCEIKED